MCGNGCRVFASFVKISGIHAGTDDVKFLAGDGMHYGNYDPETREGSATFKDIAVSSVEKVSEPRWRMVIVPALQAAGQGKSRIKGKNGTSKCGEDLTCLLLSYVV